jgi:hypothetical protein
MGPVPPEEPPVDDVPVDEADAEEEAKVEALPEELVAVEVALVERLPRVTEEEDTTAPPEALRVELTLKPPIVEVERPEEALDDDAADTDTVADPDDPEPETDDEPGAPPQLISQAESASRTQERRCRIHPT